MDLGTESVVASELTVEDLYAAIKETKRRGITPDWSPWANQSNRDKLAQLWSEGWSATYIASQIPGMTRNSVLGRLHRTKANKRKEIQRARKPRKYWGKAANRKEKSSYGIRLPGPKVIEIPIVYDPSHQLPLLEANPGQCRWINGEPTGATTLVCGAPVAGEVSWCPYHSSLVYAKRGGKERPLENKRKPTGITLRAAVGLRL
jgi:hypothetical protein